jgi:hypothetical protein
MFLYQKIDCFFLQYTSDKMEQFEQAMIAQGVPKEAIHKIKTSPVWISEFKRYTQFHVDTLIYLFPKIYHTMTERPFVATTEEMVQASRHYVPMDISE